MSDQSLESLAEAAKQTFQSGNFAQAANEFARLAEQYADQGDALMAAEMKNNQSVALLQNRKAQAALELVLGTEEIFAQAGDLRRQGLAIGNRAAALEALKRIDEAAQAYTRSAELLDQAGATDERAMVQKALAALDLKRGKMTDSAFGMMEHLASVEKPTLFQRFLKFLLRFRL